MFELLELHDAIVSHVAMRDTGEAVVAFGHVAVYERQGDELFDVVSYQAELIGERAANLRCPALGSDANSVAQVRIDGSELGSREETRLVTDSTPRIGGLIQVVLSTGEEIVFRCESIKLVLTNRGEPFEKWEGPL